jgi:hypothetical protein
VLGEESPCTYIWHAVLLCFGERDSKEIEASRVEIKYDAYQHMLSEMPPEELII